MRLASKIFLALAVVVLALVSVAVLSLRAIEARRARVDGELERLRARRVGSATLFQRLCRPDATYADLAALDPECASAGHAGEIVRQIEVAAKYDGYIKRMLADVERFKRMEGERIPDAIDYATVPGLSREIRERLAAVRPRSLGQASRVPGVTPAAISVLSVWCHRLAREAEPIAADTRR